MSRRQPTIISTLRDDRLLRLAIVTACLATMIPALVPFALASAGAFTIKGVVRWINRRDDPRFAEMADEPS